MDPPNEKTNPIRAFFEGLVLLTAIKRIIRDRKVVGVIIEIKPDIIAVVSKSLLSFSQNRLNHSNLAIRILSFKCLVNFFRSFFRFSYGER